MSEYDQKLEFFNKELFILSENQSSKISCINENITFTIICNTNILSLISFANNSPTRLTTNERTIKSKNTKIFFPKCLKYSYSLSNSKFCQMTSSGFGALFI